LVKKFGLRIGDKINFIWTGSFLQRDDSGETFTELEMQARLD
jgi:hypothetical protein